MRLVSGRAFMSLRKQETFRDVTTGSPQKNVLERAQKFHTYDASLPRYGYRMWSLVRAKRT